MRRRHLIAAGSACVLGVPTSRAQPRKVRIGFLGGAVKDAVLRRNSVEPFLEALRGLGYVEGQNLELHLRFAEGLPDRLPGLAAELLALKLDVLVTMGPRPARVAQAATTTLPVVAVAVDDPVAMGLVADFVRPGGNITGISGFGGELVAKRLQLMKEFVPSIERVAVLQNPVTAESTRANFEQALKKWGDALHMRIVLVDASTPDQFEAAFDEMRRERVQGVLVLADAQFGRYRDHLHELVAKHRLPSIWGHRDYLRGGGLASYQSDFPALFRSAASMVDRILKGAKPAVTPFEQATKLELVINMKTARMLGLAVPQSLLLAADDVIR
jgi:putative ABC transport system substrate-binding protein